MWMPFWKPPKKASPRAVGPGGSRERQGRTLSKLSVRGGVDAPSQPCHGWLLKGVRVPQCRRWALGRSSGHPPCLRSICIPHQEPWDAAGGCPRTCLPVVPPWLTGVCVACEGARHTKTVATFNVLSRRARRRVMVSCTITRTNRVNRSGNTFRRAVGAGPLDRPPRMHVRLRIGPVRTGTADCVRRFLGKRKLLSEIGCPSIHRAQHINP